MKAGYYITGQIINATKRAGVRWAIANTVELVGKVPDNAVYHVAPFERITLIATCEGNGRAAFMAYTLNNYTSTEDMPDEDRGALWIERLKRSISLNDLFPCQD